MLQRFLDPATLASIAGLDLVAKTVVDGFVAGLHRSPDFGFSQEFAEYRAYARATTCATSTGTSSPAPTDATSSATAAKPTRSSSSCSTPPPRWAMAPRARHQARLRPLRRRLALLHGQPAARCRRPDRLRRGRNQLRPPSTRQGQLFRLLHAIEKAEAGTAHRFRQAVHPFPEFPAPARHRGGDVGFLRAARNHRQDRRAAALPRQRSRAVPMLDPQEIEPKFRDPVLLVDLEDDTPNRSKSRPSTRATNTRSASTRTSNRSRVESARTGLEYFLMDTATAAR